MLLLSPNFIDDSELHHRDQEVENVENNEYLQWLIVYVLVEVVHHLYDQHTLVDGLRILKVMRVIGFVKVYSFPNIVKGREWRLKLRVTFQRIFEHKLQYNLEISGDNGVAKDRHHRYRLSPSVILLFIFRTTLV
jgi:hypothetical protein